MKNKIKIIDWAGNVLFEGSYKDKQVSKIIKKNTYKDKNGDDCLDEISIFWVDENDQRNIWELIDF